MVWVPGIGRVFKIKSYPLTPALSPKGARGKGSRFLCYSKLEFGSVVQVGVTLTINSVSPLYLWERARVRAAV
jgi:hypothetical protein